MFNDIKDENFAESTGKGLVMVLFYKEQCPYCKAMKKIITKFSERPGIDKLDISYLTINRDENPRSAEEMGVDRIPSVIVFRDGTKTKSKSGDVTYRELEQMVA